MVLRNLILLESNLGWSRTALVAIVNFPDSLEEKLKNFSKFMLLGSKPGRAKTSLVREVSLPASSEESSKN